MIMLMTCLALAHPSPTRSPEWVDARIQAWQPTAHERAWQRVGWAKDIRSAEKLALQYRRPVFFFTHDGRLNVGRC
jgi:hypothetical protein